MYRILSIDGGGIRGIIPARFLSAIEEKTGVAIAEHFDMIVGTSTGGIIAAGLTVTEDGSTPIYSAEDLLNLYFQRGQEIFEKSAWRRAGKYLNERYSHQPLERILKEYFGNHELKDTLKPVIISSYDLNQRRPHFFKTLKAQQDPETRNHPLWHVMRSTSAAPTYFEPFQIVGETLAQDRVLVDGGVFANNPAMVGFTEALKLGNRLDDILICSIGTGASDRPIRYEDAKDFGLLEWAKPISGVMMDGQSDAIDHQLSELFKHCDGKYFRFETDLKGNRDDKLPNDDLDDTRQKNLEALLAKGAQLSERVTEVIPHL